MGKSIKIDYFTLLLIDEVGQFAIPDLLDTLRSNLRDPKDLPMHMVTALVPSWP
jgi:hypothetical protein